MIDSFSLPFLFLNLCDLFLLLEVIKSSSNLSFTALKYVSIKTLLPMLENISYSSKRMAFYPSPSLIIFLYD